MPRGTTVLGVDVGGTGIKARLVRDDGTLVDTFRTPTPRDDPDAHRVAEAVVDLVERASTRMRLDALGVVTPGVVDEAAGTVVLAVNLGWRAVPVADRIRAELDRRGLGVPLAFGHDVRAGALAEAQHAGLDRGVVAFLPVGTGLASALVVDGRVLSGDGWAGEVGQVRITSGPHAGHRVEEIASASAVARRSGTATAQEALDRMHVGDPVATAAWRDCVDVLADTVAWTTAVAGCHTLVVGGGLALAGADLLDPLRAAVAERLTGVRVPEVVPARHGDQAGAIGAALLARRTLDRLVVPS